MGRRGWQGHRAAAKAAKEGGNPPKRSPAWMGGEAAIRREWKSMAEYCRRIVSPFNIINSNGFIGGNLMI